MQTVFSDRDLNDIIATLKNTFLTQDNLSMYRDIHEYTNAKSKFAGDDHVFSIYDKQDNKFYYVVTPYDVISKKAPQHALVFAEGKLVSQFNYTEYANMRTGAMDALLVHALKIEDIAKKRILIIGTGNITKWSLRFLKAAYPQIKEIDYINSSLKINNEFEDFGKEYSIQLSLSNKSKLKQYDLIICHTSSNEPIITKEDENNLSRNVIVTAYLTLYDFEEISDQYWDTDKNNVVVSWNKEIDHAKDLQRAQKAGFLNSDKLITLQQLLNDTKKVDAAKRSFFRSSGTPIQNAALIKYLISK